MPAASYLKDQAELIESNKDEGTLNLTVAEGKYSRNSSIE